MCLYNRVLCCVFARYQRRCCRKAGGVLTVRCVKAVESLMMKVAWYSVMSVTLASISIALIRHLMRFRRVHGSASGASCVSLAVRRRRALSTAVRGKTITRSVRGVPVWRCAQYVQSATLMASWYCSALIVNGLFHYSNDYFDKKLSYCWETVRRESMTIIAEMDVEMTT